MTKIRVELLLQEDKLEKVIDVLSLTNNTDVCWHILDKSVRFNYSVGVWSECIGKKLNNDYVNRQCISIEGICECDVDIKKNTISNISIEHENSYFSKLRISNNIYHLEDFYEEELKPNIVCTFLSIFFTCPLIYLSGGCVYVYLNDAFYKREFLLDNNIQEDLIENYASIIKERLCFQECWNWLTENTSIFQKGYLSSPAFSTISYVLNRTLHESLVYSTIGLESLFCSGKKNTKYLLSKRIPQVFSGITEDDIKKLYQARSDIVHGNIKIGNYYSDREIIQSDDAITESCVLGAVLLVESIRKLIKCNATHYVFQERIEYKCE